MATYCPKCNTANPDDSKFCKECAAPLQSSKDIGVTKTIIATETGIIHTLRKCNPKAEFIPASERAVCPNMKKITLEKVINSLYNLEPKIKLENNLIQKAKKPQKFKVREYNRCEICGRPKAYYRRFKMCRICLRKLAHKGELPGVTKASW